MGIELTHVEVPKLKAEERELVELDFNPIAVQAGRYEIVLDCRVPREIPGENFWIFRAKLWDPEYNVDFPLAGFQHFQQPPGYNTRVIAAAATLVFAWW